MQKIVTVLIVVLLGLYAPTKLSAKGNSDILETIRQMIVLDLKKRTNSEVEITSLRVIKGQDLITGSSDRRLIGLNMDRHIGKNRVYYVALIEDKKDGLGHVFLDTAFDTSVEVFVTNRPLQKGATLTERDYYPVRYRASKVPTGAVTDRSQLEGKLLTASLSQGIVIRESHLTETLLIKRGHRVNIVVETEGISLTAPGILRTDAPLGGVAKVYCELTKREIQGLLVNQGTVKVRL